jgi:hypothetical protein
MRVDLKASVEVIDKYAPNVRQAFDDFLAGLPNQIATVEVTKDTDDAEQVQQPAEVRPSRAGGSRSRAAGSDA